MLPIGREIPGLLRLDKAVPHNTTEILQHDPLCFKTPALPWAYSVAFEVQRSGFDSKAQDGDIVVELDLEVREGEVYAGALTEDLQEFLGSEISVGAAAGRSLARVVVSGRDRFFWLMIRNSASAARPALVRLYSLNSYETSREQPADLLDVRPPGLHNLPTSGRPLSPLIVSEPPATGTRESSGLDQYLRVLRKKWDEVPAGILGRRRTTDLLELPEEELKAQWLAMHRETIRGHGFPVRGWYQLLYQDVLRGKKVLDVGSGLGLDSISFARSGARVTFLDIVRTNQQVIRKLCRIFGLEDVQFVYMETIDSLNDLPDDFDFIWCQGSMINAPFEYMKVESQALLRHLPVGGRWIELAYPRQRWEREGALPFDRWGEKTDGPGTPWMEWYDLEKWRARMVPGEFDLVLHFSFHNDDFCWFDLVRTG